MHVVTNCLGRAQAWGTPLSTLTLATPGRASTHPHSSAQSRSLTLSLTECITPGCIKALLGSPCTAILQRGGTHTEQGMLRKTPLIC